MKAAGEAQERRGPEEEAQMALGPVPAAVEASTLAGARALEARTLIWGAFPPETEIENWSVRATSNLKQQKQTQDKANEHPIASV